MPVCISPVDFVTFWTDMETRDGLVVSSEASVEFKGSSQRNILCRLVILCDVFTLSSDELSIPPRAGGPSSFSLSAFSRVPSLGRRRPRGGVSKDPTAGWPMTLGIPG